MDFLPGLVVLGTTAVMLEWITSRRTVRGLDLFAAGFLPYRADGCPQGVQEPDPVPWSWSATSLSAVDPFLADDLPDEPTGEIEIVEITRGAVAAASPVHRDRLGRGSASRPR